MWQKRERVKKGRERQKERLRKAGSEVKGDIKEGK